MRSAYTNIRKMKFALMNYYQLYLLEPEVFLLILTFIFRGLYTKTLVRILQKK
jgi:hypothetical protein